MSDIRQVDNDSVSRLLRACGWEGPDMVCGDLYYGSHVRGQLVSVIWLRRDCYQICAIITLPDHCCTGQASALFDYVRSKGLDVWVDTHNYTSDLRRGVIKKVTSRDS